MKSILTWISSSFFRTIGRIIAYIGIGFLVFLFISKTDLKGLLFTRLNAQVNNDDKITLNYNSDFIQNNKTNDFFGSNGYLETIRNTLNNRSISIQNGKYLIGFTQDDIVVVLDMNENSEFYMFSEVYTTFDRILINSNGKSGTTSTNNHKYYFLLSECDNLDSFLNAILTQNVRRHEYDYRNYYRLAYTTNVDLRNKSYDWFTYNNKYFVPYASNTNIKNACYGSGCDYSDIQNIPFLINGVSTYIPTYFDLFSYNIPSNNMIPDSIKLYKQFFTINPSDLSSTWSLTTSINVLQNNNASVSSINVYGLVNDNGLYHYEDISSQFTISDYHFICSTINNNCTFEIFNSNISYTGSLSNYSKIYFDIVFSNFISIKKGSFNFNRSIPGIIDVGLNDVNVNTLFLQLESSTVNTYTFTTYNFLNTQIYYNNVQDNTILYNMPSYIDLANNVFDNNVHFSSYNYYYGTFNQVIFNDNILSPTYGLIMNLYNNGVNNIYNPSGSFQILYFITPNVYWSDSAYSIDRNSVNICYDNNGNYICNDYAGDFHNYHSEYSNVDSYFNIIKGIMSDDMYGLSGLINTPLNKIKNLTTATCDSISIPVPFTNSNITIPCMSTIYSSYIPTIYNIWKVIVLGIVSYYVGVGLFRDIKNTLESDKNDVEVIEL